jgi:outer membrane protein OmpA-like peptidoglycan-associated protein/tetratricopeptide (TPR) repeat protein
MKTKYIISTLFIILVFSGFAIAQTSLPKAEQEMQKFEYVKAIDMYLKHFEKHAPNDADIRNISLCYMKINDTKHAVEWLSKISESEDANAEDVMIYAGLLKSEGKYENAILQYRKLKQIAPQKSQMADKHIAMCEKSINWMEAEQEFSITNEIAFNSTNSDFGLVPFGDGFLLTSDRVPENRIPAKGSTYEWTGNPYLKLYKLDTGENGELENLSMISELNHDYHNGPGFYDAKASTLYFTRTKLVKQKTKPKNPDPTAWFQEDAGIYTNRLEIYTADYVDGKWQNISEFEHNDASRYSSGHPVLSPDGTTLYFVSDMADGYGESDIYYCEKQETGEWGEPQNAGSLINTAGKELFPSFDTDGTFYFASNGHPGMGGLDMFSSEGSKTSWSEPENLRYPINSPKDDFAIHFTEAGIAGYFASNRNGGQGSDDIYSFEYSPPPSELILAVTSHEKPEKGSLKKLPGIKVQYQLIGSEKENTVPETSPGVYHTRIDCNESYRVTGTNPDYFSQAKEITTECKTQNDTVFVDLVFEKIVIDKPIVIENIYYDYNKWNIRDDAAVELDKIVTLLEDNPRIIIELGSHTDSRGTKAYNENLSQLRAESAVDYIISEGISEDRITAKGYGEYELVNECSDGVQCTEEQHQMNRRTEFKVIGMNAKQPVIHSASR